MVMNITVWRSGLVGIKDQGFLDRQEVVWA